MPNYARAAFAVSILCIIVCTMTMVSVRRMETGEKKFYWLDNLWWMIAMLYVIMDSLL